jgi:16S rRNA processing protein RimM
MDNNDFFYLGKIIKPIGGKGHLAVLLDVDDPGKYKKLETVFVAIDQNRIPYSVQSVELKAGNRAIFKFEDVDTPQDASPFSGHELYLPLDLLPRLKGKSFYHHEIVGFTVIDKIHGNIGTVGSVLDLPRQSLLQVKYGTREILIPMAEGVVRKVDRKNKIITVQSPEGLIDIYL